MPAVPIHPSQPASVTSDHLAPDEIAPAVARALLPLKPRLRQTAWNLLATRIVMLWSKHNVPGDEIRTRIDALERDVAFEIIRAGGQPGR